MLVKLILKTICVSCSEEIFRPEKEKQLYPLK